MQYYIVGVYDVINDLYYELMEYANSEYEAKQMAQRRTTDKVVRAKVVKLLKG